MHPVKTAHHLLATLAAVIVCHLPLPVQAETFEETRAKAEQGDAKAQFDVGLRYSNGLSVVKNDSEAVKWFREAGEQDLAEAQLNIGWHYANGDGVEKDEDRGVNWFHKAANQGNVMAQQNLGSCYYHGNGVVKIHLLAYHW